MATPKGDKMSYYDNHRVEVELRNKGDYGIARISGLYYTHEEHKKELKMVRDQILRHVDKVGNAVVRYDKFCECGEQIKHADEECCNCIED